MLFQYKTRSLFNISVGLLLTCCVGCNPDTSDPQEAAWNRVFKEEEEYLSQHASVVSKVRQRGGEVMAFRESERKPARFSLFINFSDQARVDDSVLKELLDGSPVRLLLTRTSVSDAGLVELRNDAGIEALDLYGTSVGDQGLGDISTLSALKVLGLGKTKITDQGMPALNTLKSLERLSIPDDEITDEGVAQLRSLHTLRSINLDNTGVTDAVVEPLALMKSLAEVRLSGTQVTSAGITALRQALPQCKIYTDQ